MTLTACHAVHVPARAHNVRGCPCWAQEWPHHGVQVVLRASPWKCPRAKSKDGWGWLTSTYVSELASDTTIACSDQLHALRPKRRGVVHRG